MNKKIDNLKKKAVNIRKTIEKIKDEGGRYDLVMENLKDYNIELNQIENEIKELEKGLQE